MEHAAVVTSQFTRRMMLKRTGLAAVALGAVASPAVLAACTQQNGTGAAGPAKSIDTITLPFLADMGPVDPDIFYAGEGNQVLLSVYEGLVTYASSPAGQALEYQPPAKRIVPGVAESWDISPDGRVYTFHLRPNVKFHDGTTMDAEAWRQAFVRRAQVNQGPAYLVEPVESTAAPDPLTFVVTLKKPLDPFLDYLANPYSPKVISPKAVQDNTSGDDLAQGWLAEHEAGTGPYRITEWVTNDHYTLEAFPDYWGQAPEVKTVNIPIIPNIQTQQLQYRAGDIDLLTKGLAIQDVDAFQQDGSSNVNVFPLPQCLTLFMNPTAGRVFADQALRSAVASALDRPQLVQAVFKQTQQPSTQFFPGGCFPDGLLPDKATLDPSKLTAMAPALPSNKVDLAYAASGGAPNKLMAELIQAQLKSAGLDVQVRPIDTGAEMNLYDTPDAQRPDMLIELWGGDTIHVDTVLRQPFCNGKQPLNWFNIDYPAATAAMNRAANSSDTQAAVDGYAEAGGILQNAFVKVNISNAADVIVSRRGIANITHDPMAQQAVRLADLKSSPS